MFSDQCRYENALELLRGERSQVLAHRTMLLLTDACAKSVTPRNEMINSKGVVQMLPTASSLEAGNLARSCLILSSQMAGGSSLQNGKCGQGSDIDLLALHKEGEGKRLEM